MKQSTVRVTAPPRIGQNKTMTCLFCRILAGTVPSAPVYSDERIYAFQDVNPQAPLHVLIVPRRHISTLNDLNSDDDGLVGEMMRRAAAIAKEHGYGERGYRTVFNCNGDAGQSVHHIHLHLLAGRRMTWPPG
jgi:histidine triad (HIT) family protein